MSVTTTPHHHNRFTALFPGPTGWAGARRELLTLWCKGRLTEGDTSTIRLGTTPSGLSSATSTIPPLFFTGRMPFLPPNQQCQSTEGNYRIRIREKTLEFSSTVLPAPSPYLHATNQQRQITEQNSTHGLPSTKDNYSLDLILSSLTPDGQLPLPQCWLADSSKHLTTSWSQESYLLLLVSRQQLNGRRQ